MGRPDHPMGKLLDADAVFLEGSLGDRHGWLDKAGPRTSPSCEQMAHWMIWSSHSRPVVSVSKVTKPLRQISRASYNTRCLVVARILLMFCLLCALSTHAGSTHSAAACLSPPRGNVLAHPYSPPLIKPVSPRPGHRNGESNRGRTLAH